MINYQTILIGNYLYIQTSLLYTVTKTKLTTYPQNSSQHSVFITKLFLSAPPLLLLWHSPCTVLLPVFMTLNLRLNTDLISRAQSVLSG